MRTYGMNKTTDFTKKQIGVIFAKAKRGELKVERWAMAEMYDLADYYGKDFNGMVELEERRVLLILKAVFDGDLETAQEWVDSFTESVWNSLTEKRQAASDRSLVC